MAAALPEMLQMVAQAAAQAAALVRAVQELLGKEMPGAMDLALLRTQQVQEAAPVRLAPMRRRAV